jgi:hypothetical protein
MLLAANTPSDTLGALLKVLSPITPIICNRGDVAQVWSMGGRVITCCDFRLNLC